MLNSRPNATANENVFARLRVSIMSATRSRRRGMPRIFSCALFPISFRPSTVSIAQNLICSSTIFR